MRLHLMDKEEANSFACGDVYSIEGNNIVHANDNTVSYKAIKRQRCKLSDPGEFD